MQNDECRMQNEEEAGFRLPHGQVSPDGFVNCTFCQEAKSFTRHDFSFFILHSAFFILHS